MIYGREMVWQYYVEASSSPVCRAIETRLEQPRSTVQPVPPRERRTGATPSVTTTTRGSITTRPSFPPCMPSTAFAGEFPGSWASTIKVKSNILSNYTYHGLNWLKMKKKGAIMLGTYLKVTDIPVRATMHHRLTPLASRKKMLNRRKYTHSPLQTGHQNWIF